MFQNETLAAAWFAKRVVADRSDHAILGAARDPDQSKLVIGADIFEENTIGIGQIEPDERFYFFGKDLSGPYPLARRKGGDGRIRRPAR